MLLLCFEFWKLEQNRRNQKEKVIGLCGVGHEGA